MNGPTRQALLLRVPVAVATMRQRPRCARTPMNAVEIEQAISDLALQPFDAAEFPFAFLAAFGNKDTTLKRLRAGNNNASDVPGGVLQRNNIHIAVCPIGTTGAGLHALRSSSRCARSRRRSTAGGVKRTLRSEIPLTNFRGIEPRDFPAEIARLALIIAEFQSDVLYRGQKDALEEFLPLSAENWIIRGNALQLDWLSVCPPTGTGVKVTADDLFETPLDQAEIDFDNEGGETYICGNPPYLGFTWQTAEQKSDLRQIFEGRTASWKSLDYVSGWFMKAADYGTHTSATSALVSTNSICQGEQVPILWPLIFSTGSEIVFAHESFKWTNLASNNAGVTVAVIGLSTRSRPTRLLYASGGDGSLTSKAVQNINAYLVPGPNVIVDAQSRAPEERATMHWGNKPSDGGNLILAMSEANEALRLAPELSQYIFDFVGSQEFVRGIVRRCIWVEDSEVERAKTSSFLLSRFAAVRAMRKASKAPSTQEYAEKSHRFRQVQGRSKEHAIVVPKVTSESRPYLPVGVLSKRSIVSDNAFALYDADLWNMAVIATRLHLVWIATVCGQLETRYRYSNTLGWNTFPVPPLTEQNKADLTRCAENILLAREAHFPATIANLYDPDAMPENLRQAHEHNDEVLERIYIGRRFKNDTERLEKLFDLYTKMTAAAGKAAPARKPAKGAKA